MPPTGSSSLTDGEPAARTGDPDRLAALREAQRLASVGIWEWRPSEGHVQWSEEQYRLLGYEPGEVEPSFDAFLRRVHPDDRDELERLRQSVIEDRDRRTVEAEFRVVPSEGEVRWVRGRARGTSAEGGHGLRLVGVTQDVTDQVASHRSADRARRMWETTVELAPTGIAITDPDTGRIVAANRSMARFHGYDREDFVGARVGELDHWDDPEQHQRIRRRIREEGEVRNELVGVRTPSGELRYGHLSVRSVELGGRKRWVQVNRDVTDLIEKRDELRRSERRYRKLFEHNVAGVFRSTPEGTILEANQALADILGYERPEDLEGRDARLLFPSGADRESYLERLLERGELTNEELHLESREGRPVWVLENSVLTEDPETGEAVIQGTLVDITGRKRAEERLEEMAYRDPLTGLANRRRLADDARRLFSLAERRDRYVGLVYLDLDGFKQVNDRWGHDVGDEVLREVAERLEEHLREGDVVARVGGDEFVVLFADLDEPEAALGAARRLTSSFDGPAARGPGEEVVPVEVSAGLAAFPVDGEQLDGLLRRADRALARAKEGGGRIARYRPETDVSRAEASELDREIREGLETGQFELHYQPVVALPEGTVEAGEALVRWRHPARGLLAASDFIVQAERTGVVREIDEWVLARALEQLAAWQEGGEAPRFVAVNLSAVSLRDPRILRRTEGLLRDAELSDRSGLVVEVTESEAMQDPAVSMELLQGFRKTGVGIALDDFGTGHSSLSYLGRFPVDQLKLDRRFVAAVPDGGSGSRLARAVIEMAKQLGLEATAEGVEEPDQLEWLARAGCDRAQGYHCGRPMPADEFEERLAQDAELD